MSSENEKKVAVITGAASGIGFALARACVLRQMHVVMADNAENSLIDSVEQLSSISSSKIFGIVCDVSKPADLLHLAEQTQQHFQRVDWLFNNAGICGNFAPVWELTSENIHKVLDINLHGVIHGIQAFLPLMFLQQHRSHIINMASFYGLCSGSNAAAYSMSKHAVLALSESLYFDLLRHNKPVDVSIVCPSFINTQLVTNSKPAHSDTLHDLFGKLITMGRPAEDVAEQIIQALEKNIFYILPDKEVKNYCEQRTQAILEQDKPHEHSIEKIITAFGLKKTTGFLKKTDIGSPAG